MVLFIFPLLGSFHSIHLQCASQYSTLGFSKSFQKVPSPNTSEETAHIGLEGKPFEGLVTGKAEGKGGEAVRMKTSFLQWLSTTKKI